MKKNNKPIIVISRNRNRYPNRAQHGSWKIAYADFMTAMMAIFLVLALIGNSTPGQLQHVADYFKAPIGTLFNRGHQFSDSESPIPGGGDDFRKTDGEEQRQTITAESMSNGDKAESAQLLDIGKKIAEIIQLDPRLKKLAPNLIVELTEIGLRIQILSRDKQPMFAIGSADIQPEMKTILRALAPILNGSPNKITLSGHTDERKYPTGDRNYSNWELSADRANRSRQELIAGGLNSHKIIRVIALADTVGLHDSTINRDSNRRISIVILNKQATQAIQQENIITGIDLLNGTVKGKKALKQIEKQADKVSTANAIKLQKNI